MIDAPPAFHTASAEERQEIDRTSRQCAILSEAAKKAGLKNGYLTFELPDDPTKKYGRDRHLICWVGPGVPKK